MESPIKWISMILQNIYEITDQVCSELEEEVFVCQSDFLCNSRVAAMTINNFSYHSDILILRFYIIKCERSPYFIQLTWPSQQALLASCDNLWIISLLVSHVFFFVDEIKSVF